MMHYYLVLGFDTFFNNKFEIPFHFDKNLVASCLICGLVWSNMTWSSLTNGLI